MSVKVAVVTGANKGLGFALVKGLCEKFDGIVYLTSRDEKRGMNACEELKRLGLSPKYHQLDITSTESVKKFTNFVKNEHGTIDLLINNAGILFLKDATEPKVFLAEETMKVNLFCLIDFCEEILPLVRNGGKIVNITSSSGHLSRIPSIKLREMLKSEGLALGELKKLMQSYVEVVKKDNEISEGWGDSSYVVSKVGVNAYTFMLQRRLQDRGITVDCIHPGYVQSDMTRGAGNVTPGDAAEVVLKLALEPSRGGRYVWHNGQDVPWDGPDPRGYIDGKNL